MTAKAPPRFKWRPYPAPTLRAPVLLPRTGAFDVAVEAAYRMGGLAAVVPLVNESMRIAGCPVCVVAREQGVRGAAGIDGGAGLSLCHVCWDTHLIRPPLAAPRPPPEPECACGFCAGCSCICHAYE